MNDDADYHHHYFIIIIITVMVIIIIIIIIIILRCRLMSACYTLAVHIMWADVSSVSLYFV
jgi:hypothetical protein